MSAPSRSEGTEPTMTPTTAHSTEQSAASEWFARQREIESIGWRVRVERIGRTREMVAERRTDVTPVKQALAWTTALVTAALAGAVIMVIPNLGPRSTGTLVFVILGLAITVAAVAATRIQAHRYLCPDSVGWLPEGLPEDGPLVATLASAVADVEPVAACSHSKWSPTWRYVPTARVPAVEAAREQRAADARTRAEALEQERVAAVKDERRRDEEWLTAQANPAGRPGRRNR